MATGWPAYGFISACEIALFVQKLVAGSERPLSPIAVIQRAENSVSAK